MKGLLHSVYISLPNFKLFHRVKVHRLIPTNDGRRLSKYLNLVEKLNSNMLA